MMRRDTPVGSSSDPHHHHPAAFSVIAATLPLGSVAVEPDADANGERLVWLDVV